MNINVSNEKYSQMTKKASPNSKTFQNCTWAFCVGGFICAVGEAFKLLYMYLGLEKTLASTLSSVTLIFFSVLFTSFKFFDNIAKHAGAGTIVPITGFANSMASPSIEFKSEGFILGTGAKMFSIAGPVLVFGISASVIYGLIYYLVVNVFG